MSNWEVVTEHMSAAKPIELGPEASNLFHNSSTTFLSYLTFYKFAAKMIGRNKKVLDLHCKEGLGSYLLFKECGLVKGFDSQASAIESASDNFNYENLLFTAEQPGNKERYDALVWFQPKDSWNHYLTYLKPDGLVVFGTRKSEKLSFQNEMRKAFNITFFFSENEEVVHTGSLDLAENIIGIGCYIKGSTQ